jgi:hypothetical protein
MSHAIVIVQKADCVRQEGVTPIVRLDDGGKGRDEAEGGLPLEYVLQM